MIAKIGFLIVLILFSNTLCANLYTQDEVNFLDDNCNEDTSDAETCFKKTTAKPAQTCCHLVLNKDPSYCVAIINNPEVIEKLRKTDYNSDTGFAVNCRSTSEGEGNTNPNKNLNSRTDETDKNDTTKTDNASFLQYSVTLVFAIFLI